MRTYFVDKPRRDEKKETILCAHKHQKLLNYPVLNKRNNSKDRKMPQKYTPRTLRTNNGKRLHNCTMHANQVDRGIKIAIDGSETGMCDGSHVCVYGGVALCSDLRKLTAMPLLKHSFCSGT